MSWARRILLAFVLAAGLAPAFAQAPSPVPALPDTERRQSYTISGTTCACAVNFQLYGDGTDYQNWVEVFINGVQVQFNDPTFGWAITSPSGSLSTLARPITDAVLTFNSAQTGTIQIVGARRPRRTSQFSENRGVPARDLNQAITDLVAMLREDWDKINDVTGRAVLAPPGETLALLQGASLRANKGACFDGNGNLISCVLQSSGAISAGNGILFSGTNPVTITNNVQATPPLVISGTNPLTFSCPTCNTTPGSTFASLPTRAGAVSQSLSAFAVLVTGGYATAGDGGGAMFKNVGSAAFIDTNVTSGNITNNGTGSCTNGTYFGAQFSGGTGTLFEATVVVSGNVVTSVTQTGASPGYTVGDVLSTTITGCSTTVTWTVSAISTPTGSFTDFVGTHWQIIMPAAGIDARAFGVKFDWNGTDGSSTDNFTTLENAFNFAAAKYGPGVDLGGGFGGLVRLPKGSAMFCGSNGAIALQVYQGVTVRGQGSYQSTLKVCDTWSNSTNLVEICNSQSHLACFNTLLQDMQIFAVRTLGTGSSTPTSHAAVFTNNCQQQHCGLDNVVVYTGACRRGIDYETGFGGASTVIIRDVEIKGGVAAASCGAQAPAAAFINYGTTQVSIEHLNIGGLSGTFGGPRDNGLAVNGGFVDIEQFYAENVVTPMTVNIPTSLANGMVRVHGIDAGTGCVWAVVLANTNTPGNFAIGGPMAINSCSSGIVQDGQPSGVNMTSPQVLEKNFNP